jgi:hypothetical protein
VLLNPPCTADGFIAPDIFNGSVNKDHFMHFLNEELHQMCCAVMEIIDGLISLSDKEYDQDNSGS